MDKTFFNRLNRLEGQLKKLRQSIDEGDNCHEVIPQFLAVKGAMAGAFEEYLKQSLQQCHKKDVKKINTLITTLIKA